MQRRHLRTQGPGAPADAPAPGPDELRPELHGATLVSLAEVDGRLLGVTVDALGARLEDAGPADRARSLTTAVAAALRRAVLATSSRAGLDAPPLLTRSIGALDAALAGLLAGDGPVVLVVPPVLHAVPWQLLPALAGRPVTLVPSATWWLQAQRPAGPAPTGPAVVAAGPRLVLADREARSVAAHLPGATLLTGSGATSTAVLSALPEAPVAHLACHGRIRHDSPLWSSLELADGPLYVHDLHRLARTPPLVVLSGCETGVGVRAGDQLLGLSAALLARGTRQLVASVAVLPDSAATCRVMDALHVRVAAGTAPAPALAALSADPQDGLLAACLTAFGSL